MLEKINDQMITHCNSSAIIIQMFTVDNLLQFWSNIQRRRDKNSFGSVFFVVRSASVFDVEVKTSELPNCLTVFF